MSSNTAALVAELRRAADNAGLILTDPPRPSPAMALLTRAADALSAQAKELEEASEREAKAVDDLCRWRAAFQRVTPGGSEFFDPKAVREWADKLKTDVFEVNKRAVLATRERDEALAALKASEAREAEAVAALDGIVGWVLRHEQALSEVDLEEALTCPRSEIARARAVLSTKERGS